MKSRTELFEGRTRRVYRITAAGREALVLGRSKVRELFGELITETEHKARIEPTSGASQDQQQA